MATQFGRILYAKETCRIPSAPVPRTLDTAFTKMHSLQLFETILSSCSYQGFRHRKYYRTFWLATLHLMSLDADRTTKMVT